MSSAALFRRSVEVFVGRHLSPQARSAALAQAATDGVAELIRTGQAPPSYRRFVDGREGAAEDGVKPDGVIVYRFNRMGEVAVFALAFLQGRSPRDSGRYKDSFYVAVNGRFIPPGQFNPAHVPADAEIVIGNTQPYSRKVDVQMVGREPLTFNAPAGLFEDAARAVQQRFGGTVTAKRVYTMKFPGQYRLRTPQYRAEAPHLVKRGPGAKGRGKAVPRGPAESRMLVESPAIIINPVR